MEERCSLKQIAEALALFAMDSGLEAEVGDHDEVETLKPLDTFIWTICQFRTDFELKFKKISDTYKNKTFSRELFVSFLEPRCKMILDISENFEHFGLIMSCSFVTEMLHNLSFVYDCVQFYPAAYEFLSEFLESRFKALEDETHWNSLLNYCREINITFIHCRRNVNEEYLKELDAAIARRNRLERMRLERIRADICNDHDYDGGFCEVFDDDVELEQNNTRDSSDDDKLDDENDEHAGVRDKHFHLLMPDREFRSQIFKLLQKFASGFDCFTSNISDNEAINVQTKKDISTSVCERIEGNFRREILVDEQFMDSSGKVEASVDEQLIDSIGKVGASIYEQFMDSSGKVEASVDEQLMDSSGKVGASIYVQFMDSSGKVEASVDEQLMDSSGKVEASVHEQLMVSSGKVGTSVDEQLTDCSGEVLNKVDEPEAIRDAYCCRECRDKDIDKHFRIWMMAFRNRYKNLDKVSDFFNADESDEDVSS